ncbi:hypothetical protein G6F57_021163 [Rhizopus arrhizus]|nr:hypothetical protein G6F57_021163 [Rhizopus arrhizus]
MVSTLMEKPSHSITPSVPSSATGTTSVGMSVARKFCMNRYITQNTRATASSRVISTFWIEISTKVEVS